MTTSTLNDYEADQVRAIALWKSERSSLLLESYRSLTRPISKLLSRVVPKDMAGKALKHVEATAEYHDPAADILEAAGASAVPDLLNRTLDECDRLADRVKARAEHLALLEGVVPAAVGVAIPEGGGAVAAAVDVPVLLEASLRTIRRIGHSYGFPLDSVSDRRFVLAILDIANGDDPAGEAEIRGRLWDLDRSPDLHRNEADVARPVEESIIDDLPIEAIPIVGDVANLVLDYAFVRRVDETARRVFQERWLRANGKVDSIEPSPISRRRSSVEGIVAVASEVAYAGAYGVSFGVTFPATLAARAVESVAPDSVLQGFRDGASAAGTDSRAFLDRLARSTEPHANGALMAPASG
jgi:hypothetical protein